MPRTGGERSPIFYVPCPIGALLAVGALPAWMRLPTRPALASPRSSCLAAAAVLPLFAPGWAGRLGLGVPCGVGVPAAGEVG